MKPLWVIQENLNQDDRELLPILDRLAIPYKMIKIIPFDDNIQDIEWDGPIIVRGSTTALKGAEKKNWKPGVWHNDNFRPSVYLRNYGYLNMNHGKVYPLNEVPNIEWESQHLFIRPNSDYKEFSGGMMERNDIIKLARGAELGQYPFPPTLELFVCEYRNILHEARFTVVDKKVVAGHYYRFNKSLRRNLAVDEWEDVFKFAVKCAARWGPDDVYSLDIGVTKDHLMGVVECNCFNASGLYGAQETIINEVTTFVERKYS